MIDPDPQTKLRLKLESLGAARLAGALVALAEIDEQAAIVVQRLTASGAENLKRLKARLTARKRATGFIDWSGADAFARELAGLLADIKDGAPDPIAGLDLIGRFFKLDDAVFNQVDDSDGGIAPLFQFDAQEAFLAFAAQVDDKTVVSKLLLELLAENEYGARDNLLDGIDQVLSEAQRRELIAAFRERADALSIGKTDAYERRTWLGHIETLARQLGDADLYRDTCLEGVDGKAGAAISVNIAEVYFEIGDLVTARQWLESVPDSEIFYQRQRDGLMMQICRQSGDKETLAQLAWRRFRAGRSSASVAQLMSDVGASDRTAIIAGEVALVLNAEFTEANLTFLLEEKAFSEASQYVLAHAAELDGEIFYYSLAEHARTFDNAGYLLAASVIYRALLDAILERGRTKAYGHAARYLLELRGLNRKLTNWQDFPTHEQYETRLRNRHGQKRSFWPKVNEGGGR